MLYEHVNSSGEVTERVRPVVGSPNAEQLAVKANDPKSGWRLVDETAAAPKPRRSSAPANTPEGGALS